MSNFKEELFLKIFDDERKFYQNQVSESKREQIAQEVIKIRKVLDHEELELDDLREGPASTCTLSEAVEKLAFELKNDRNLYASYKSALKDSMSSCMSELAKENTTPELFEIFGNIANDFLNKFIRDVEHNKSKNETLETL